MNNFLYNKKYIFKIKKMGSTCTKKIKKVTIVELKSNNVI